MKTLLSLFLLLALGASAATGIKISEYPNTPVLTNSELFIVAVTNVTPATNRNISYGQLRSLLASNNFVGSFTGDGRNVSNVVAAYVSGTLSNNISGNASSGTNLVGGPVVTTTNGINILTLNGISEKGSSPDENWLIGEEAGGDLTTGIRNVFVGSFAGHKVNSGNYNTIVGFNSGANATNGSDGMTCLGYQAGAVSTGSENTFVGFGAAQANTTGWRNTIVGYAAGQVNTTGYGHVMIGGSAGQSTTTGLEATFVGVLAGGLNITGDSDVYIGPNAGGHNTNGSRNVCVGMHSGMGFTSGDENTILGTYAGYDASTNNKVGNRNVLLGYSSGAVGVGSSNVFIGPFAGYYETNNSRLFIDNNPRASVTDARSKALIYGVFAPTTSSQSLYVNAVLSVSEFVYSPYVYTPSIYDGNNNATAIHLYGGYDDSVTINTPAGVVARFQADGNIAANGAVIATNAFVMPPVSAGPAWCTNGLAAIWNSNTTVYIRTSAVGATTYADKLVAP